LSAIPRSISTITSVDPGMRVLYTGSKVIDPE
jgi:hypothetical protein